MLHRRAVVSGLLEGRPRELLAVAGLGSAAWDLAAAGDHRGNFHFIGAMGQAAPFALGLALAQPRKRVLLFTGDGDMLMGLGSLATLANRAPRNLAIVVLDNQVYQETGSQATATAGPTDLAAVARGCGITSAYHVTDEEALGALRDTIFFGPGPVFVNVRVAAESLPLVFPPSFDGVTAINRFREAATNGSDD